MKIWHLALAVVALGLILRLGLGALPAPADEHAEQNADPAKASLTAQTNQPASDTPDTSCITVLPFDLQGEVPGPLLTSILQQYMPESTPDHADALRNTLPPGEDPRMIVIIPEADEEVF